MSREPTPKPPQNPQDRSAATDACSPDDPSPQRTAADCGPSSASALAAASHAGLQARVLVRPTILVGPQSPRLPLDGTTLRGVFVPNLPPPPADELDSFGLRTLPPSLVEDLVIGPLPEAERLERYLGDDFPTMRAASSVAAELELRHWPGAANATDLGLDAMSTIALPPPDPAQDAVTLRASRAQAAASLPLRDAARPPATSERKRRTPRAQPPAAPLDPRRQALAERLPPRSAVPRVPPLAAGSGGATAAQDQHASHAHHVTVFAEASPQRTSSAIDTRAGRSQRLDPSAAERNTSAADARAACSQHPDPSATALLDTMSPTAGPPAARASSVPPPLPSRHAPATPAEDELCARRVLHAPGRRNAHTESAARSNSPQTSQADLERVAAAGSWREAPPQSPAAPWRAHAGWLTLASVALGTLLLTYALTSLLLAHSPALRSLRLQPTAALGARVASSTGASPAADSANASQSSSQAGVSSQAGANKAARLARTGAPTPRDESR